MKWLNGIKTYLGMIVLGILGLSYAQGWIDGETAATIGAIVGPLTGVALRLGVKKAEKAVWAKARYDSQPFRSEDEQAANAK